MKTLHLIIVVLFNSILFQLNGQKGPITREDSKLEIETLFDDEDYKKAIQKSIAHLKKWKTDSLVKNYQICSYFLTNQSTVAMQEAKSFYVGNDSLAESLSVLPYYVTYSDSVRNKLLKLIVPEALKLNSKSSLVNYLQAVVYINQSDFDNAEKYLKISEENSDNVKDQITKKCLIARLRYEEKSKEQGEELFKELFKEYGNDTTVLEAYVGSTHYKNELEKALSKIDLLIENKKNKGKTYHKKIMILEELGRLDEACKVSENLCEIDTFYEFLYSDLNCKQHVYNQSLSGMNKASWLVTTSSFEEYNFDIELLKKDLNNQIEYNWSMSNDENQKGKVYITKEALENGHAQHNYYYGGGIDSLIDRTSIWLSKEVFQQIIKDSTVLIDCGTGAGDEKFNLVRNNLNNRDYDRYNEPIMVNGVKKYVNCLHIMNEDETRHFWILNSAENPIIIKMDLSDFKLQLKSVE